MPNFEAIAGIEAAARFLIEEGMDRVGVAGGRGVRPAARRVAVDQRRDGVGIADPRRRVPTAAFTIDGVHPAAASQTLAAERVAVWDGHNYAVEVVDQLGLADTGGVDPRRRRRATSSKPTSTAC